MKINYTPLMVELFETKALIKTILHLQMKKMSASEKGLVQDVYAKNIKEIIKAHMEQFPDTIEDREELESLLRDD